MASTSSSMNEYDVFLSFRGADTRNNFTSHLYNALCKEGVNAFMDKNLRRGDEISSTLFKVIEASQISIVIFSQNYASSKFCLDEVVKILECKAFTGQIVFPAFYDVDPFEVEKQTGRYQIALSGYEAEFKEKMGEVQQWKSALAEAADLSGSDLRNRDEAEVIREIVEEVLRKLNRGRSTSAISKESRVQSNEEKQQSLRRRLAVFESIKADINETLTDIDKKKKYKAGDSLANIMEDTSSNMLKLRRSVNKGMARWNEFMLNDLLSTTKPNN